VTTEERFHEGQELVLYRLDEIKTSVAEVRTRQEAQGEQITKLRESVAGLRVKAGVWGLIAGAFPALGAALLWFFGRGR
jgi:hypothetical protein